MRRIAAILLSIAAASGAFAVAAGADEEVHTYKIELFNAFGLVEGSDIRVAGVNAGSVTDLTVNEDKRAVLTVALEGELSRLGDESTCRSSPQSLIAEYFLDCDPAGEPLPEGGMIPASRVEQTVQPDIVANTMREPYRQRLTILVNEFGTALAGNPEALNEAIKLGAPALTELEEVTEILAGEAEMIRDLNVDSERVSRELARYREQIVDFVDEAEDLASTALERRDDVSRGFDLFDDYLAELRPTLAQLDETARQQRPLLAELRGAAPELHRLTNVLPEFQRASDKSLHTLGDAAVVGERALRHGRDEIELLAEAGRPAPLTSEILADLVRDLDDPRRTVEINDLAERTTGRTSEEPGTRNTKGYTGFEALLNYPYYQALSLNQFDRGGHSLAVTFYDVNTGPCGTFSSGHDLASGEPGVPAQGGGTTTEFSEVARCATWLGPNQPGLNEDLGLPPYDPAVCPNGTAPEPAKELCDPGAPARANAERGSSSVRDGRGRGEEAEDEGGPRPGPSAGEPDGSGSAPDELLDEVLDDVLELPESALDELPGTLGDGLGELGSRPRAGIDTPSGGHAAGLLDFLFSD